MNATPLRVLIIEDSEADFELNLAALRAGGFDVSCERVEGEDGLRRALSASPPQVVLTDYSMPGFDGMRALQLVRELAPGVPCIFVSGTIGEERAIEALRQGATDYVLKDNMRRLGTVVRRALAEADERERVRAAEAERARLVEILEATSDLVSMSDPEGRMIYLNAAGRALTGIAGPEVTGRPSRAFHPPWAQDLIDREAEPTAARAGVWQGETAIVRADSAEIPVSQVIIAHRADDGRVRYFSTIARDIRDRKAYEARLEYLANHDALTGLPNRTLLADRTAQAIVHARRALRPAALLVLDLDRFKVVINSAGVAAGDALLRMASERLRAIVREGDTVARLEADAFAVLAADLARADDVVTVARKIQQGFRSAFILDGRELHATVSVGASVYPRDGDEFEILLRNANSAMHRVKAEGRDGFQFYAAGMTHQADTRLELESELRLALARGDLEVHYQPQVTLADRRVVAVEALMRWPHRERGWISPDQFVPIAEDSGLIQPLGEFALAQGCQQIKEWDDAGLAPLRVAVNVSAHQFRSADFVQIIDRTLRAAGLKPDRVELELTEGVLIENRDQATATLQQLKGLGLQIAIDDFGTGYSSLSYLSRLPIDSLKIDRAFVHRVTEHGRDAAIAQAIISLAHALGLRVVAEGVETAEQLEFLLLHGCDEAQGYLFCRPLGAPSIASLVASGVVRGTRPPAN